ncbi:MAG: ATP-binding protein [Candidatus Bathyarchaeia archaeon]
MASLTLTKSPKWVQDWERSRRSGRKGFIFVFNTTDYVYDPTNGLLPCRLKYYLAQRLQREGYTVWGYSLGQGLYRLSGDNQQRPNVNDPRNPEEVLRWLTRQLRQPEPRIAIVIDHADLIVPNAQGLTSAVLSPMHMNALELLNGWGMDDAIRLTDNLILLISYENQVHDLLMRTGSGYHVLQVGLPDEGQRLAFIQFLMQLGYGQPNEDLPEDELARITGGLRLVDIDEIFCLSNAERKPIDRSMVREKKAQTIKQMGRDLLEVIEPNYGFESVAGLRHVIEYLQLLIWQIRSGVSNVPQALLLVGPPGVGKSFIVSAVAKELGWCLLKLGNIREKWVGASERNLEMALWIIETLAPCIVWVDEIDQAWGGQRNVGPSADAGTSERMMARLWEFMGSMKHRGRILWIGTTNRPDILDAATLDRFQVIIPFLHPTIEEIKALLPVLASQVGRELAGDVKVEEIAQVPSLRLPTVRALQEIVSVAGILADISAGKANTPISHSHLLKAAHAFKPNYNPIMHEFIALTAIRMTNFNFLLPWFGVDGLRRDYQIPSYLHGIVDESGNIDTLALHRRLSELERQLGVRW